MEWNRVQLWSIMRRLIIILCETILLLLITTSCLHSDQSLTSTATMEDIIIDQVREIVEGFGEALKQVSVQSPDVTEEILQVYAQFVSPELIDQWLSDPALAPGRVVSSPWPERIEIQSISEISSTKYSVAGRLIELTSQELVTGGSANEIPVRIMVENKRGNWMITEYSQDSFQP